MQETIRQQSKANKDSIMKYQHDKEIEQYKRELETREVEKTRVEQGFANEKDHLTQIIELGKQEKSTLMD